jgi:aspartate racemase
VARIGLLGGMSWESSAEYYRLLNVITSQRLGGLHSADCVLLSVDFAPIEELQATGRWDEAGQVLADAARSLEAAGCEVVLLCTNTMHRVYDAVQEAVSVPVLHLVDVAAEAVKRAYVSKVGLLGTAYTMAPGFYIDRLLSHGLSVVVPQAEGQRLVHRVIYDELCRGVVTEESRSAFLRVIDTMVSVGGAEGVILGCTEIELLLDSSHTDVPLFPTTRLHVEAALDESRWTLRHQTR